MVACNGQLAVRTFSCLSWRFRVLCSALILILTQVLPQMAEPSAVPAARSCEAELTS